MMISRISIGINQNFKDEFICTRTKSPTTLQTPDNIQRSYASNDTFAGNNFKLYKNNVSIDTYDAKEINAKIYIKDQPRQDLWETNNNKTSRDIELIVTDESGKKILGNFYFNTNRKYIKFEEIKNKGINVDKSKIQRVAYDSLISYIKKKYPDIHKILTIVRDDDDDSMEFHKDYGFEKEGYLLTTGLAHKLALYKTI